MQTDVIANELAIRLFLFGLSAMCVFEGMRAQKPFSYGIWFFAGVFFLTAAFLSPLFGLWPSAVRVLSDLVSSPLSWFVVLIGIFFAFRPIWAKPDGAAALEAANAYDDSTLKADIDQINLRLSGLDAKVEQVRVDGQIALNQIEKLDAKIAKISEQTLESLYAIHSREKLLKLEPEIDLVVSDMYDRLHGGETYDHAAWEKWESCHAHWEDLLEQWIANAQWYAPSVQKKVMTVDDKEYNARWSVTDNQFPNSDAVRKFKRFRLIHSHWSDMRKVVAAGAVQVAFVGQSSKDLMYGDR